MDAVQEVAYGVGRSLEAEFENRLARAADSNQFSLKPLKAPVRKFASFSTAQNQPLPSIEIETKIESLFERMTLEEKIDLLGGTHFFDVPGIEIQAWYPGQEGGRALAEILFGDVNPSGRLPVTFEKKREDNPSYEYYYPATGTNRIEYKDGVFVGYRGYEKNHVQPFFPFGYGLSYTTFKFGDLKISPPVDGKTRARAVASFSVTNTGTRAGATVGEVYLAERHTSILRPLKELKGFAKVDLKPGETQQVQVPLNDRAFCFYDEKTRQWRAGAGTYEVIVGSSSEKTELSRELKLEKAIVVP